jgi:hypothetical protein
LELIARILGEEENQNVTEEEKDESKSIKQELEQFPHFITVLKREDSHPFETFKSQ